MQCTKLFPFSFSECNFRGEKAEKFVRLKENARKGTEAFKVQAYPRRNFNIQALDGVSQNSRFAISFQVLKINSCVKFLVRRLSNNADSLWLTFQSRMPDGYFSFKELDRRRIGIYLERSLQDLVDRSAPITAIQFRYGQDQQHYISCVFTFFLQFVAYSPVYFPLFLEPFVQSLLVLSVSSWLGAK